MRLGVPALLSPLLSLLLSLLVCLLLAGGPVAPAQASRPIEDYAPYEPASTCHPHPMVGTRVLAAWVVRHYRSGTTMTTRACGTKGRVTSEHQTGRAFDWTADVRRPADRRRVKAFLADLFATDAAGNEDARARRMGIMYVIWADRIYSAYDGFAPRPYLNADCKRLAGCSRTLRHRDHVHVSLDVAGARGRTSWYEDRLPVP